MNLMSLLTPILLMQAQKNSNIMDLVKNIMLMLLVYMLNNITTIKKSFKAIKLQDNKKARHKVQARITLLNNMYYSSDIPIEFKAVMHYLYTHLTTTTTKYSFNTEQIYMGLNKYMSMIILENPNEHVIIADNISLTQSNISTKASEKESYSCQIYSLYLASQDNCYHTLNNFIDICINKYVNEELSHMMKPHIFVLTEVSKETKKPI